MHALTSIIAQRDGRVGRILMNRPQTLNALDLPMIRAFAAAAAEFRDDPAIQAVIVEAQGGRAFCAGGDVRALRRQALAGEHDEVDAFFAAEYALNRAIAEYPKPYVALVDGVCMGGGIGVSVHGTVRVATEHAVFAMPETAIGMFPDIGASYFLPRLPGFLGMYLALTGERMQGADAVHVGLATHFVPRDRLAALSQALAADGVGMLAAHAAPLPPFTLAPHRPAIDHCFSAPSVPDILQRLKAERTVWADKVITTLRSASPSALFWSHAIISAGARRALPECLAAERALARHVIHYPDFAEGVRAMVVDKDRQPKWRPASIEDVDQAAISAAFR